MAWLRAVPQLARPISRTMPWGTLLGGCLAGTVYLAIVAHAAKNSGWLLGQGNVRLAFLPVVAAVTFLLRSPFRPLTQAVPIPAWVTPAGHLLLSVPILAATCWAQLHIMTEAIPPNALGHPPAIYPLIAQLTGWCVIAIAAAACVERSRYADLSGVIAVPVSFIVITCAWFAPVTSRILVEPPATAHGVTIAWYAVVATATALTCAALRDQWHRGIVSSLVAPFIASTSRAAARGSGRRGCPSR